MNENIEDLVEEMKNSMKRAEHSVFVSLKYTRTVDVIKNLLERFSNTILFGVDAIIEYLYEKQKISEKPETPIEKINLVKEKVEDEKIDELMDFLLFLRKAVRATYGKCEEFRRHVTMSVKVDGNEYNVDIDLLTEFYERLKHDVEYIEKMVLEIEDED